MMTLIALALPLAAQDNGQLGPGTTGKKLLEDVGIDQKLNAQVPLDLKFRDEMGRTVRLGDYFGARPVILTLNYYRCPMLCSQVLNGLASTLSVLKFEPGRDFQIVTLSIDPTETPILAADAKENYLKRLRKPGAGAGWHFLTGDAQAINALASSVGFRFAYDQESRQYAHASGIVVLTPQGKVARYYYGIEYPPNDLRLGLVEASQGRIGNVVDAVLLLCYHYDPSIGKYTLLTLRVLKGAAVTTLLMMGLLIGVLLYRESESKKMSAGQGGGR